MPNIFKLIILLFIAGAVFFGVRYMKQSNVYMTTSAPTVEVPASASVKTVSDASLDDSLKSIDAKLDIVSQNSVSVDQSFKDTPVAQTE